MIKFERSTEEINKIAKETESSRPILSRLKTKTIPDEQQWQIIEERYDNKYHFNKEGNLIIDNSIKYNNKTIKYYGQEKVLEWLKQDEKRLKKFQRGHIWLNGVIAEAIIHIPSPHGNYTSQTIKSGGLYGIESDTSTEYIKEVEKEELQEVKSILKKLNVVL